MVVQGCHDYSVQQVHLCQTTFKSILRPKMETNKSMKYKELWLGHRLDVIFKGIEWIVYVCFCILAGIFMVDVIAEYRASETFMSQSLKPITKLPTITLCMTPTLEDKFPQWVYQSDVRLDYHIDGDIRRTTLNEKEALHFEHSNETVMLEQVSPNCLKLNSTLGSALQTGSTKRNIDLIFMNGFTTFSVTVIFTSEENSYGIFANEWLDGKPAKIEIRSGRFVTLTLEASERLYLHQDMEGYHCSEESFLQQWMEYIPNATFSRCSKKCVSYSFLASENLPLCARNESKKLLRCSNMAITDTYRKLFKNGGFKRPCNLLEYSAEKTSDFPIPKNDSVMITYMFAQPELLVEYKERLVFDILGLVAYVGGTLGMCIGFSFIGTVSSVLDLIKNRIKTCF